MKKEEVKYYTLTAQVLANIVFCNLLPKLDKYSHAMSCTSLLIYCFLQGIRVNIPKLIINFMLSEHLVTPSRNLPCEMIITHLLKYFKINVSGEKAFDPSVEIDRTLLKKIQASTHAHAYA